MRVKVILNRIEKHAGFVYTTARWVETAGAARIEIGIRPRVGARAICSGCGRRRSGYDVLGERRFAYVPLWGIAVFLVYPMRRVACRRCGVRVEQVPWATGKQQLTASYLWFLARWARRLSWSEVARIFGTSWTTVFRAVEGAVEWGRQHASFETIEAIGVDEVQWRRGHKYLTVVYEISGQCRRLLWVGEHREEATLRGFFAWLGAARAATIRFVCSDMWKPYLTVIAEQLPQAIHVLDRFHIVQTMNKAIDEVRAKEAHLLKAAGADPVLTHSRWCLLKRPRNLTDKQENRLQELLRHNLRTVRAYLLKEDFQFLWGYASPSWAGRFLDAWCGRAMHSRIEPMKKIARSLRAHRRLILNWFHARRLIALGAVEGFNNKLKLTTRRSYGFRSSESSKSRCIMRSAIFPSRKAPTDSVEEAEIQGLSHKPGHRGCCQYVVLRAVMAPRWHQRRRATAMCDFRSRDALAELEAPTTLQDSSDGARARGLGGAGHLTSTSYAAPSRFKIPELTEK